MPPTSAPPGPPSLRVSTWALFGAMLLSLPLLSQPSHAADEVPGSVLDHAITVPKRGQHMSRVRHDLGEPRRVIPWVGDPPITRWVYPRFTIYFKEWRVIGVVANRPGEGGTYILNERNE